MTGKCPCRDCTERILLCHGRCEKYQAWKKAYEETRFDYRNVPDVSQSMKRHIWRRMKEGRRRV